MMTDAYALRHGWSVLLTGGVANLAYRGPLWAPYATAHCRPAPRHMSAFARECAMQDKSIAVRT